MNELTHRASEDQHNKYNRVQDCIEQAARILATLTLEDVAASEYIVTAKAHLIHAARDFVRAYKILEKRGKL